MASLHTDEANAAHHELHYAHGDMVTFSDARYYCLELL